MHNNSEHICRVCGFWDIDVPWGEDGKTPTFFFCPCCGVEHGYQDITPESVKRFREKWLANNVKWNEDSRRPSDWNLDSQMINIPKEYI